MHVEKKELRAFNRSIIYASPFAETENSVHLQFDQKNVMVEIKVLITAWEVYFSGQHECVLILHFLKTPLRANAAEFVSLK